MVHIRTSEGPGCCQFKQIQQPLARMQASDQPFPIRVFLDKLKIFTIFNVLFLLWAAAQMVFYIITTTQISCTQMKALFIGWTCSYAFEILAPIACLLVLRLGKYYRGAYGYIVMMCLVKIGVVISVLAVAWRHVGLCYITYDMRVIIIVTNCLEVLCLAVELLLLWRARKVNREVLLNNLAKKKLFAEY